MARSFSITLDEFKGGFVNRRVLVDVVAAKKRAALQARGELIRRLVNRTLRPAKKLPLDAGVRRELGWPPKVPIYKPNPSPLFPSVRLKGGKSSDSLQNISKPLFALDNQTNPNKITVGPPKLQAKPVPALLERGGSTTTASRRRVRRVGGGGEIRLDRGSVSSKTGKTRFGKQSPSMVKAYPDGGGSARVVYIRLRTQSQVARSQAINHELYRPGKPIRVQGRRYMRVIAGRALRSADLPRREQALFNGYVRSLPKATKMGTLRYGA